MYHHTKLIAKCESNMWVFWYECLRVFAAFDTCLGCLTYIVYIDKKLRHMPETWKIDSRHESWMHKEICDDIWKCQFHPQRIKQTAELGCLTSPYTNICKFAWFYNRTYIVYRMMDILEFGLISQKLISKYIPLGHQLYLSLFAVVSSTQLTYKQLNVSNLAPASAKLWIRW